MWSAPSTSSSPATPAPRSACSRGRPSCWCRWRWPWWPCFWSWRGGPRPPGRAAILGLILGGALGNLADRFFRDDHGAVVDFVALHFWPTFNVADASHRGGVRPAPGLAGAGSEAVVTVLAVTVPASLDGVRVDKAVSLVADLSRSTVNSAGRARDGSGSTATWCGAAAPPCGRASSSRSTSDADRGPAGAGGGPGVDFEVVYEDPDVIVVDKPAGLVVHPGAGTPQRDPGPRPVGPLSRSSAAAGREWARTPTAPGSSTGSTGGPRV